MASNVTRNYQELVSREFSFQFSRKCLTPSKRDRVFSVAEHLCLVAIAKPLVVLAANNLFQGSQDCHLGANNLRQKRKKMLKQEDARRRLRGMCWCKKELPLC